MNLLDVFAAIGMLTLAGLIGFTFAWLEDQVWKEAEEKKHGADRR